jgi:hypothetical protein
MINNYRRTFKQSRYVMDNQRLKTDRRPMKAFSPQKKGRPRGLPSPPITTRINLKRSPPPTGWVETRRLVFPGCKASAPRRARPPQGHGISGFRPLRGSRPAHQGDPGGQGPGAQGHRHLLCLRAGGTGACSGRRLRGSMRRSRKRQGGGGEDSAPEHLCAD